MSYKIVLDGDKSQPPLVVVVERNNQTWYQGRYVFEKDILPEQEWPTSEKQSTGSDFMDKFLDWLG